ncbi:MAG: hypothetical protein IPK33_25655 [Gemmatimonadetes bacterium]|nr:hypothetical protein [Gemmatimonadota bacterium]
MAQAELQDAELRVRGEVVPALRGVAAIRERYGGPGTARIDAQAAEVAQIAEGVPRGRPVADGTGRGPTRARGISAPAALRWTVKSTWPRSKPIAPARAPRSWKKP